MKQHIIRAISLILFAAIMASCSPYQSLSNQPMTAEDQAQYQRYQELYPRLSTIQNALEDIDKVDSVSISVTTSTDIIINVVHARGAAFTDNERQAIEEAAADAAPDIARDNMRINYGLRMTLADVAELSEKGEAITMADVREYVGYDPLSGLYGWQCEVFSNQTDESSAFVLNATSGGQDGTLMHAYLHRVQIHAAPPSPSANDADPGIDIRYYDVMAYAERGEKLLVRPLPTEPPPSGNPKKPPHASDL